MYTGSCHCGLVTWKYRESIESVTACNCSLCRRYGALWAYGYLGQQIEVGGETAYYSRGNKHNGFHFCKTCGAICYYQALKKDQEGRLRTAVNLRTILDPGPIQNLPIDHFEGLVAFEDLPRDGRTVRDLWF